MFDRFSFADNSQSSMDEYDPETGLRVSMDAKLTKETFHKRFYNVELQ